MLAIEHDWRLRKLIRANLEAQGIEVGVAVSGQHGLEMLKQCHPDVILLDLDLPDSDALGLLAAVRKLVAENQVFVIVLAEEPPSQHWRQDKLAGGYLQKPFAVPALLLQVERALADRDKAG